jgi:hypothetical protein
LEATVVFGVLPEDNISRTAKRPRTECRPQ